MKIKDTVQVLNFLTQRFRKVGVQLTYAALLLLYAFRSDQTPPWAKRIILGALAYMLSPIDSIPDLTPVLGFTDDLGVISFGLVSVACYIDRGIREKALHTTQKWFGTLDQQMIKKIDAIL